MFLVRKRLTLRTWPSMLVVGLFQVLKTVVPLYEGKPESRVFSFMLNFHTGQDELPQSLNTELLFPPANRSTEKKRFGCGCLVLTAG